MPRRIKALGLSLAVFSVVLVAIAAPASASTHKCSSDFCVQVNGKGTHVDSIQYSIKVHDGKTFSGYFTAHTKGYRWAAPDTLAYVWSKQVAHGLGSHHTKVHYTRTYKINKTFANKTRLYFSAIPNTYGAQRYKHTISSVVVHK